MLRLEEELMALVAKAAAPAEIDVEAAERMLDVLGLPRDEPVILSRWWNDGDRLQMRHYPRKNAGEGYDWEALQAERLYGAVANDYRVGVDSFGFVPERGGVAYGKRKEITEVRFLKYEIDDEAMSLDAQNETWIAAGLPTPTLVLFTGGKSLHFWWRLKTPLPLTEGIVALKRLQEAIRKATPGVKLDPKMESPAQPMRLAGGIHPKTGVRSEIFLETGDFFEADELLALCPELPQQTTSERTGTIWRDSEEYEVDKLDLPELPLSVPVPLTLALGENTVRLINEGMEPGQGGRRPTAHRLSKTLQAAEEQLQELGQPFEGSALELWQRFLRNSNSDGDLDDLDEVYDSHWEQDQTGEGDLSKAGLLLRLRSFANEECGWDPDGWFKNPSPGGFLWRGRQMLEAKRSEFERLLSDGNRLSRGRLPKASKPEPDCWREQPCSFWRVSAELTPELIVQEALRLKAEAEGRPLTSFQGRFLRYDPGQGYFQKVPVNTLKREIATQLLPKLFSENASGTRYKKFTTDSRASNCVKWLSTVLHEDQMDVVPAIAFSNGTYRLKDGQLIGHSPDHRLTFSVQGDYQPCSSCPPAFRDFVLSSFGEEWLPVMQMTLRYLVDPTFKPSRIVMILGPSGSGKGTLERLIEAMFPSSCISVITSGFDEINSPDKIHQFVRGKRLVTFPDLQGRQIGVGTLYSMTDGGLLTSRKLHESDADEGEAFNGRVVICSTQPPSMEDAGNGMTRRMLVLKTKSRQGQQTDLDLDDKLRPELGAIVSWALQAERADVKAMLAAGDEAGVLSEASLTAEVQMDPIRSFIDQCLTTADGCEIVNDSVLFAGFRLFCEDQGHKTAAKRTFMNRLKAALPHLWMERRAIPGTNSTEKTRAAFFGLKLVPDLIVKVNELDSCSAHFRDLVSKRCENYALDRAKYSEGELQRLKRHLPAIPTVEVILKCQAG